MTYVFIFLFGLLGIVAHAFVKINNINKRTPKEVSIKEIIMMYLRADFGSIILSVIALFLWMGFIEAYVRTGSTSNPIPWIAKGYQDFFFRFINLMSALVGYVSESIILTFGGRAESILKKIHGDENCPPQ